MSSRSAAGRSRLLGDDQSVQVAIVQHAGLLSGKPKSIAGEAGFFEYRTDGDCHAVQQGERSGSTHSAGSRCSVFSPLWSLAAWGSTPSGMTVSSAGALAEASGSRDCCCRTGSRPGSPPRSPLAFTSLLTALTPAVDSVLGLAPALAGRTVGAVWVVWGIGSVVLIVWAYATGLNRRCRRRAFHAPVPAKGANKRCA